MPEICPGKLLVNLIFFLFQEDQCEEMVNKILNTVIDGFHFAETAKVELLELSKNKVKGEQVKLFYSHSVLMHTFQEYHTS